MLWNSSGPGINIYPYLMICNSDSYYWNFINFKAIYGFVRVSLISWCWGAQPLGSIGRAGQVAANWVMKQHTLVHEGWMQLGFHLCGIVVICTSLRYQLEPKHLKDRITADGKTQLLRNRSRHKKCESLIMKNVNISCNMLSFQQPQHVSAWR